MVQFAVGVDIRGNDIIVINSLPHVPSAAASLELLVPRLALTMVQMLPQLPKVWRSTQPKH